ncbi:hypothetical protein P4374_33465, partial [Bacillus thuringiensis]|nr:hypothetical protein [Bacillus thuringiensis]
GSSLEETKDHKSTQKSGELHQMDLPILCFRLYNKCWGFCTKEGKKNARRLLYPLSLNCPETKKG